MEDVLNTDGSANIKVSSSDNTALFVTLTTQSHGRFSQNRFVVVVVALFLKSINCDVIMTITLALSATFSQL